MMWVYGAGGSRFFAAAYGNNFTSPDNDLGSLVRNYNSSYTYTAKNQIKWNFNSSGQLTSIVVPTAWP